MVKLPSIELEDEKAERVRRATNSAIEELQALPFAGARVIRDVTLADGVAKTIAHKLGRAPRWVGVSVLRGAVTPGVLNETRGHPHDAKQVVVLTASGYGATVTVDVVVLP
jgi:hypothetical protein